MAPNPSKLGWQGTGVNGTLVPGFQLDNRWGEGASTG